MNLSKRAIHLAVAAGVVGSMVGVAAPAAHAAGPVNPDACGVYLQGNPDPAGGLIPAGLIPFPAGGNASGQKAYAVTAHESKGQDKIVNDLNNTAAGATRFKLGVSVGGGTFAPVAPVSGNPAGASTSVGIQWKNDANGLGPKAPLIIVAEKSATKPAIAKGFVTAGGSADRLGAQIGIINDGNNGTGPGPVSGVPGPASSSSFGLYVPPAAATGTFKLTMKFPPAPVAPAPVAGLTFHSGNISVVGLTPAIIATSLNTPAAPGPGDGGSFGNLGGGVSVVAGPRAGTFVISFAATALAGQGLPSLSALLTDQTGALATTLADDGGAWVNAWRNGGVDAGLTAVSSLGNGVFTSQGTMSSGNIPAVGQKNTGKWYATPDTQYLFLQYPAATVTALVPNLGTATIAQGILQSIVGPNLTVTLDECGLLGILGLFCTAASASIPPAFTGICGLL